MIHLSAVGYSPEIGIGSTTLMSLVLGKIHLESLSIISYNIIFYHILHSWKEWKPTHNNCSNLQTLPVSRIKYILGVTSRRQKSNLCGHVQEKALIVTNIGSVVWDCYTIKKCWQNDEFKVDILINNFSFSIVNTNALFSSKFYMG